MNDELIPDKGGDRKPRPGNLRLLNDGGFLRALDANGRKYRLQAEPGTPVSGVAATGTLTVDTNPTAGDTMTIGATTYTFRATAAVAGEITIGANLAATKPLIVSAINGDSLNAANASVSAATFSSNNCTLTARVVGAAANSVATTETYTAGTNVFAAATLSGGVDGTVASRGDRLFDTSFTYLATANLEVTSTSGWYKQALTAL
jgi:hypothetical protein